MLAAERLVTRLKFAKKHPRADATAIDAGSYPLVLTNEWAEANLPAGLPDSRTDFAGFRPLSDLDDVPEAFNPAIADLGLSELREGGEAGELGAVLDERRDELLLRHRRRVLVLIQPLRQPLHLRLGQLGDGQRGRR